jgi:hypothetical protein
MERLRSEEQWWGKMWGKGVGPNFLLAWVEEQVIKGYDRRYYLQGVKGRPEEPPLLGKEGRKE